MRALFLFHLRVGVRVAVRSFIPLFAAIVLVIMFAPSPAATATALALGVFAPRPAAGSLLPVAALFFLLPLWAAPRLSTGMTGWIRHLSCSGQTQKRGLVLALAMSQIPVWASLCILGIIARLQGREIGGAIPSLLLLLAAGAYAAAPVQRRVLSGALAFSAAACAFSARPIVTAAGALLLVSADLLSGVVRERAQPKPWRSVVSFFEWRIAWRAVRSSLPQYYILSLLIIAATALFALNSELRGSLLAATCRFGGLMAAAFLDFSLAARLAARRPPWPWARSFPVSSYQRVASDAAFLGLHSIPLLIPLAFIESSSPWFVLASLPLVSVLAARRMRIAREHRGRGNPLGAGGGLLESFILAALTALLPWTVAAWIVGVYPAFVAARNADTRQRVSLWLELHYLAAGDPLNWSGR